MIEVELKIIDPRIKDGFGIPSYATSGAAAIDVNACAQYTTKPDGKPNISDRKIIEGSIEVKGHETVYIGVGFAVHMMSKNLAAILIPRSSSSATQLVLANGVGLIDSDYTGELIVALWNRAEPTVGPFKLKDKKIAAGERIAQLFFTPIVHPILKVVDEFSSISQRGAGGFGSTGV